MEKSIYIVRGSEDGFLGAYSNKKSAYEKAKQYMENSYTFEKGDKLDVTYSKLCSQLKKYTSKEVDVMICGKNNSCNSISATIRKTPLRSK